MRFRPVFNLFGSEAGRIRPPRIPPRLSDAVLDQALQAESSRKANRALYEYGPTLRFATLGFSEVTHPEILIAHSSR